MNAARQARAENLMEAAAFMRKVKGENEKRDAQIAALAVELAASNAHAAELETELQRVRESEQKARAILESVRQHVTIYE